MCVVIYVNFFLFPRHSKKISPTPAPRSVTNGKNKRPKLIINGILDENPFHASTQLMRTGHFLFKTVFRIPILLSLPPISVRACA